MKETERKEKLEVMTAGRDKERQLMKEEEEEMERRRLYKKGG